MAENKRITLDWDATSLTVYCIIRSEIDLFRMNDADGSFATNPADPYASLTEDAIIKGRYELDESRTVWPDGRYSWAIYRQAGGSPAPASDTIIGTGEMAIKNDLETVLDYSISSVMAQVTGTGNRVIIIHVQDTVAAPIASVLVRIGTASAYTDTSGNAVFALDDGAYDVILRKDFVTFTVPESLTVAGDGTHTYTGTVFAPSVPTEPNTCVVYGVVIDNGNNKVEGAEIFINTVQNDAFGNTQKIVKNQSTTSAADGTWEIPVIYSSELDPLTTTYKVTIEYPSFCYPVGITVPDQVSAEFSTIIN